MKASFIATILGAAVFVSADEPAAGAAPSTTAAACPAAGETDKMGRYSCNPAHAYPEGQKCEAVDGCYFLSAASTTMPMSVHPTQTGSVCPAAGSTDKLGRYSCNPAHQYPNGQQCVAFDGCYYLCDSNGKPIQTTTTGGPHPVFTGGAAPLQTAGVLALAAFGALL